MNNSPKYNPQIHHRKTIRLKGYDYSQAGLYFITMCCQDKECRFGYIEKNEIILNDVGRMIDTEWLALVKRFQNIALHEYIVMPNHFHGILQIVGATLVVAQNTTAPNTDAPNVGNDRATTRVASQTAGQQTPDMDRATTRVAPTKTVGDMVDAFKSKTTVEYIRGVKSLGWTPFNGKLWQRNYYEHIIRNEQSYQTISAYITNNPAKWLDDKFYKY